MWCLYDTLYMHTGSLSSVFILRVRQCLFKTPLILYGDSRMLILFRMLSEKLGTGNLVLKET